MKQLLLKLDPLIWFVFGQGLLIGTILLTPWVLVVGLLVPLGVVPADAVSFERMHELGAHWIGRLLLLALVVLPVWKGAHHLRHLSLDHGGASRDTAVAVVLYAVAGLATILAVAAVVRL